MNAFDFNDTTRRTRTKYKPRASSGRLWLLLPVLLLVVVVAGVWSYQHDKAKREIQRAREKSQDEHRERMEKLDDDVDNLNRSMGYPESVVIQKRTLRVLERQNNKR